MCTYLTVLDCVCMRISIAIHSELREAKSSAFIWCHHLSFPLSLSPRSLFLSLLSALYVSQASFCAYVCVCVRGWLYVCIVAESYLCCVLRFLSLKIKFNLPGVKAKRNINTLFTFRSCVASSCTFSFSLRSFTLWVLESDLFTHN